VVLTLFLLFFVVPVLWLVLAALKTDGQLVGVQVPGGVPCVRVAPGDHEDLQALADQELSQAAPRSQVDHVKLAGPAARPGWPGRHLCRPFILLRLPLAGRVPGKGVTC
jgi:ABC-type glycerol-3-phosphate transport system permease component